MKRPQPSLEETQREGFIRNVVASKKFLRLWKTTSIGGVEVLHRRRYHYPTSDRPSNYEKLFRYLGAYEDLKENFVSDGIDEAYMFLNRGKGIRIVADVPENDPYDDYLDFVITNLNQIWWDDLDGPMPAGITLSTAVVIQPNKAMAEAHPLKVKIEDLISQGLPDAALAQAVKDNFADLWLTSQFLQHGIGTINKGSTIDPVTQVATPEEDYLTPKDPWVAALARYAIGSSEIPYTVKSVDVGLSLGRELGLDPQGYDISNTVVLTVEIPEYPFSTISTLANDIATDLYAIHALSNKKGTNNPTYGKAPSRRPYVDNPTITREAILKMDTSDLQNNLAITIRPYLLWENFAVDIDPRYSGIWYGSYLRADALRHPRDYGLTFKEMGEYVTSLVDYDYEEEDVDWWKKAIAIIIFVITIIYAPGGTKGALAFAKAILFASAVMVVITIALSAVGQTEWAAAFSEAQKTVEPLVMIATIMVLFAGGGDFAKTVREKGAGAAAEAAKEAAVDFAKDYVQNLMEGAKDLAAGQINALSLEFSEKLVKIISKLQELRLESIGDRNNDLKSEYEKLQEELYRENDLLAGFARLYAKPATADWSMYAKHYDLPYERANGNLALGNIQRTTKRALRESPFDFHAFANTPLV